MKSQKFSSKNIATSIVFATIVIIGLFINFSQQNTQEAIVQSTLNEMHQLGTQLEIVLEDSLDESTETLTLLAEYVSQSGVDKDTAVDFLKSQAISDKFNVLYYIGLDGEGFSVGDLRHVFSRNEAFLSALNNEIYITEPIFSKNSNNVIFDISAPVIKDGEITAVLYAEISLDDFSVIMNDTIENIGDVFIVDEELSLLFSSKAEHASSSTIPLLDVSEMGISNIEKALQDIKNSVSSGFYYEYLGTSKTMVYYPIENTNWAFAINAETDVLSNQLISAVNQSEMMMNIVYWTVVVLLIYISFSNTRSNKLMLKAAYYDPLTELPNLAKLKLDMQNTLIRNPHKHFTILVFDIENFKAINEVFGYEMGNKVLKTFKLYSESLKQSSLITARIGDDKFAMFANSFVFENLSLMFNNVSSFFDSIIPELKDYAGTFKMGRYNINLAETDVDEIMSKVNLAHSKAKSTKGELLCDYENLFKEIVQKEAELSIKMKPALENQEFSVYLQPKFSTNEKKLVGAEALVRWIEADGTMIYPNSFIPLFERNGFIVDLDIYVFENVCKTLSHWINSNIGAITISVNCSRINIQKPNFVDELVKIVDKYNVPHEYIEIELTESTTIENAGNIETFFEALRTSGFKISIDDFGAGYSSLGMLKDLYVDTLKMDRSFFAVGKNIHRDYMLIDSIIKMSHNLGMNIVAEGIETLEQVEILKNMNCDAIQGYVYAKPMPISEFEAKYKDSIT